MKKNSFFIVFEIRPSPYSFNKLVIKFMMHVKIYKIYFLFFHYAKSCNCFSFFLIENANMIFLGETWLYAI
jgi:hypothetical protein